MNNNAISITIPLEYNALTRVSDMLHGLALDLNKETPAEIKATPALATEITIPVGYEINQHGEVVPKATPVPVPATETRASLAAAIDIATPALNTGVDLDADGLPWDARIHGTKKSKLSKTQQWKKKRNVDQATVDQVETELKAAMSAPAESVVTHSPDNANTGPAAPTPTPPPQLLYLVGGEQYTADQLKESGWSGEQIQALPVADATPISTSVITPFPVLMNKITEAVTANTITSVQIDAALSGLGLASVPLLASRPDLIPAFEMALFG